MRKAKWNPRNMLSVYQSNRIERLLDTLIGILQDQPPGDPMQPERIVVQGRGMRAWLAMQLSGRLGICANVQFPFPRAAIEEMLQRVLGKEYPEEKAAKAFRKGYMLWSIMAALAEFTEHPAFDEVKRYLSDDPRGLKRFQLAGKIADTFDQYLMLRPEMVLEWESKPEKHWQYLLFKTLLDRHGPVHIASAWRLLQQRLDRGAVKNSPLPQRLNLFCVLNLPPIFMDILHRLGTKTKMKINLFLLNPTHHHWTDLRSPAEISRSSRKLSADEEADQHFETGHPLLASMGGLMQDFQRVLSGELGQFSYSEGAEDLYLDPLAQDPDLQPSLLQQLQSDIFKLETRTLGEDVLPHIDQEDRSIGIHACHSRMREVQVLFDLLRAEFEENPDLEPDEVIVLAPHMEAYAPFVESVFGIEEDERKTIPYHISDRGIALEAPLVEAFNMLLSLVRSRMSFQEVFDFLSFEAVHRHFNMTRSEIDSVMNRAAESGICWAIDSGHRGDFGQPELKGNTWRFGLERLLLGYAMAPGRHELYGDVLPYDDIEGREAQEIGRLTHFCETLFEVLKALKEPRSLQQWHASLDLALTRLFSTSDDYSYQRQIIRKALEKMQRRGKHAAFDEKLDLDVVRSLLNEYFDLTESPRRIFSGRVSFCNIAPVRSIPFKAIVLLGINDGEFPRNDSPLSFDLTAGDGARPGDLSNRRDDRSLFLEALISAREKLIITYIGRSIRDNSDLPPSVLVGELIDTIGETFIVDQDHASSIENNQEAVRERLVARHPLQAFSPDYFIHGGPGPLYSYNSRACEQANALLTGEAETGPFFSDPLPPTSEEDKAIVGLQDLTRFFRLPVDFLLKRVLGVYLDEEEEEPLEREPMELNTLERYKLGEHLLELSLCGEDLQEYYPRVAAMGVLPLGQAGRLAYFDLVDEIDPLSKAVLGRTVEAKLPTLNIDINLDEGQLIGRLGDIRPSARIIATSAGLSSWRKLQLWIEHLALCAGGTSDYPRRSLLIGRGKGGSEELVFLPVDEQEARERLSELVAIYRRGLGEPLAFFPQTSMVYVEKINADDESPDEAARKTFHAVQNTWNRDHDATRASVVRVFGGLAPGELADFPELARRVFEPMQRHLGGGEDA